MGNATRGIVTVQAGDRALKLQFSANAMCELEDATGLSVTGFLQRLDAASAAGEVRVGDVRTLFWAGLVEHQPELQPADAGRIITELGGVQPALTALGEAIRLAFPQTANAGLAKGGKAATGAERGNPPPPSK